MRDAPCCPLDDEIVTMRPQRAEIMSGIAAWRQWKVPVRLIAMTRFQDSRVMSMKRSNAEKPALVTTISIGPNSLRTVRIASSTSERSTTSTLQPSALAPFAHRSFAARSAPSPSRSSSATRYPRVARSRLTARPIPGPAPLTTATRFIASLARSRQASMDDRTIRCKHPLENRERDCRGRSSPLRSRLRSRRGGRPSADRPDDRPGAAAISREGREARRGCRGGRARRLHPDLGAADPRRLRRAHRGRPHGWRDGAGRDHDGRRPDPDPPSDRDGAAGALDAGRVRGSLHARARPVAPLDRPGSARSPLRASGPPGAELPRGAERGPRRPGPRRRRERRLPRAQPDGRHGRPHPRPPRGARARDAPHRRRARVGNDLLDGRRARHRRARRAAHHEGRDRGGKTASADRRRGAHRPLPQGRGGRRARVGEPGARARRVLAELPATARARGRQRRRRHPRGGGRVGHRRSPARVPRRGRHRPGGARPPPRAGPRRAHRVAEADRGVPRLAVSRAVTGSPRGPLSGIRVLEVGHVLAGPFGGMLLADLGADVIKIEPIEGDLSRRVGSLSVGEHNVYFASINRNKRSVHIDLTTSEGQAELGALAKTAHALLVNQRPSTIRKLGLDYESLRRFNPKIVCVALTGYGLDGPAAEWPAFDYVIQAITGVAALTGEPDGPPTLAGYSAIDNSAGIMAALGLVAKVLEGKGGQVDVSLIDVMLSQLNYKAAAYLNGGAPPARQPLGAHIFYVPAQLFETASGYLALFVTHDEFWRRLCVEIGRPGWADDPRYATMHARFENRKELLEALGARFREAPASEWVERLRPLGIAVGAVVELADALDGELVRSREMVVSLETDEGPLRVIGNPIRTDGSRGEYRAPPRLHEHTADLLPGVGPESGRVKGRS